MAVVLIAVAILINCKPNDIDKSSEGASEDSVIATDAPEGAGTEGGGSDISEEELAALLATPESQGESSTATPQDSGESGTGGAQRRDANGHNCKGPVRRAQC